MRDHFPMLRRSIDVHIATPCIEFKLSQVWILIRVSISNDFLRSHAHLDSTVESSGVHVDLTQHQLPRQINSERKTSIFLAALWSQSKGKNRRYSGSKSSE
jgi:hypothetical protein